MHRPMPSFLSFSRFALRAFAVCLLLSALRSPASAASLVLWNADASPDHAKAWAERASEIDRWTVDSLGPDSPPVRRALADGRLVRALLHPQDGMDLALLGKTMGADWVLQPGKDALLIAVKSLQSAVLPLSEDPAADRAALKETVAAMALVEPRVGQLEALAARGLARGGVETALELLFQAQALEPNRVATQALLVEAYRIKGDYKEASRFLKMAMKLHPDDPRLIRAAGTLELAQGRPREALERFTKAAKEGATPALFRSIGEAYLALGRSRQAEEAFRLAVGEPGVAAHLARLLARRNQWNEAGEFAARALEDSPADWEMRFLLSRSLSADQRYAQAVRDRARVLSAAAEADPSSRPVSFSLLQAAIRDQLADTINAIRQLQLRGVDDPLLYTAAQESVIAADRLRMAVQGRPDWMADRATGKQRILALTLWSQGAYDLVKALETKNREGLNDPGEILHDALRQLDTAQGARSQVSTRP
ncbi:MAG: tetratricopeptide repeat protein [Armatimonadetes bacterium]|nr:tetratricopeptide repeat protein [Armatimonadota bacterium]